MGLLNTPSGFIDISIQFSFSYGMGKAGL